MCLSSLVHLCLLLNSVTAQTIPCSAVLCSLLLWKSLPVLKAYFVLFAAQRTDTSGRPRGSAVCHSVSTLQYTETHSCHHHSQKVSISCQSFGRMAETEDALCAGICLALCCMHWPWSVWHREVESGLSFAGGECM